MKSYGVVAGIALLVSGSANAVIFHPTDQNVNFFTLAVQGDVSRLELGVFDDSVVSFAGQPWLSVNVVTGDIIDFSPVIGQNTNYSLTNNAYDTAPLGVHNTLTLTGNDNFQLALRRGLPGDSDFIAWSFANSTVCSDNTNSCNVSWNFGTTQLVVDVQTVEVPPVPVPAAAWLFGSGLLGLAGVMRRQKV